MRTVQTAHSMPRPVLILTLAIGAALIGCALAVTAPFHSPRLAGKLQCAPGTTIQVSEYDATWLRPGETGIAVACVDAQGEVQKDRALETRGFWLLVGIYWVPAFIVLLLAAWGIGTLRRRQQARWQKSWGNWERFRRQ